MSTTAASLVPGQKIEITFVHGLKREYTFLGLKDDVIFGAWTQTNRRTGSYAVVADKVPVANVGSIKVLSAGR